jgi:hydrogenase-4 component F
VMRIAYGDSASEDAIEESAAMVWPQYALLATSIVLCLWMPETLYEAIAEAVNLGSGGF